MRGVEAKFHYFLTSAQRCEWPVSCPGRFISVERGHRTPQARMLGGPQSLSYRRSIENVLGPTGNQTLTVQPVARRYTE
jgi:hypothetical protein